MDLADIGRWSFVLGFILSIVVGFGGYVPAWNTILVILGLIVGFLNISERESIPFLISVIAVLVISLASLESVKYLDKLVPVLKNIISFVGSAGLVVALKQILITAKKPE